MCLVTLEMCVVTLEMCVVTLEMCVVTLEMCVVTLEMCVAPIVSFLYSVLPIVIFLTIQFHWQFNWICMVAMYYLRKYMMTTKIWPQSILYCCLWFRSMKNNNTVKHPFQCI
jgi:hypothetical protein